MVKYDIVLKITTNLFQTNFLFLNYTVAGYTGISDVKLKLTQKIPRKKGIY